jgi:hypothetical protein
MRWFVLAVAASLAATGHAQAQLGKFDGTYAGLQTLSDDGAEHNYSKCLHGPFRRKLVVKDGTVVYVYNPTSQASVTGKVTADGDVAAEGSAPSGGTSLSGRIEGDAFSGEVWSLYCTYSLQLKRVP